MIRSLACTLALLLASPALRAGDPKEEKGKEEKAQQEKGGNGDTVLDVKGKLTNDDPEDTVFLVKGQTKFSRCKTYPVRLKKGEVYQIDMVSTEIDSFLRLVDPFGKEVARDDDGGGFPDARIRHMAGETGVYKIVATCFPWFGKASTP